MLLLATEETTQQTTAAAAATRRRMSILEEARIQYTLVVEATYRYWMQSILWLVHRLFVSQNRFGRLTCMEDSCCETKRIEAWRLFQLSTCIFMWVTLLSAVEAWYLVHCLHQVKACLQMRHTLLIASPISIDMLSTGSTI